jgi:hypothetical protein
MPEIRRVAVGLWETVAARADELPDARFAAIREVRRVCSGIQASTAATQHPARERAEYDEEKCG